MNYVELLNQSSVPVTFSLWVPKDGSDPSLPIEVFATSTQKPALAAFPREFSIEPSAGILNAHSSIKIQVSLLT